MDNKDKIQTKKEYEAYSLAVYLANKCYHRDHKSEETADGCYDGAIKQDTLRSVLLSETSIIHESASFIGYCKAILVLIKTALSHKKRNRFVVIGW